MSSVSLDTRPALVLSPLQKMCLAVFGAMIFSALSNIDTITQVWGEGRYFDTDDAMRMSQVRDWLGGQGWFDLSAKRVDPEVGLFMHWSRIVDIPLAAFMKFFGLFLSPEHAEAATRSAFPALMLLCLYSGVLWTARKLGGFFFALCALGMVVLYAPHHTQFIQGRIDHHSPQIVLLIIASGSVFAACDPRRARALWIAAVCIACSFAISLENLPFFAVLLAAPALLWALDGKAYRPALGVLGATLAAALIAFYAATIGPDRWLDRSCDAYSLGYLAGGLAGAFGYLALWATGERLKSAPARFVALGVAGAGALVALKAVAPACGLDPFVALDPVLKRAWLDHVSEVEPLLHFVKNKPYAGISWLAPIVLSLLSAAWFAWKAEGAQRRRLIILAAMLVIGIIGAGWGIRIFTSIAFLSAIASALVVAHVAQLEQTPKFNPRIFAILATVPLSPLMWAIITPADAATSSKEKQALLAADERCFQPKQLRQLDAVAPGLVLAPIDVGPNLLLTTRHSILGAPYHRNNHGMRAVVDFFKADKTQAKQVVANAHADYILACPKSAYYIDASRNKPNSIAHAFIEGPAPSWVEEVPVKGLEPNVLYRVKK